MTETSSEATQHTGSRRWTRHGREQVLSVARDLFRAYGYTGVSMSQIAHDARMTKAAIYYHFKDKEDLFASVFEEELERAWTEIEQLALAGGTTRDILERVARYILDESAGDLGRMFEDYGQYVSEERRRQCPIRDPVEALIPVVERAIANRELRPVAPHTIVKLFHALVHAVNEFEPFPAVDNDQLATSLVDIFLHGVAK